MFGDVNIIDKYLVPTYFYYNKVPFPPLLLTKGC